MTANQRSSLITVFLTFLFALCICVVYRSTLFIISALVLTIFNNGGNCRWDCTESITITTSHTGNDNIIENYIISDTELSEPENDFPDENSDDETRELVNDIDITENFSEHSPVPTFEDTIREVFGESDNSNDDFTTI